MIPHGQIWYHMITYYAAQPPRSGVKCYHAWGNFFSLLRNYLFRGIFSGGDFFSSEEFSLEENFFALEIFFSGGDFFLRRRIFSSRIFLFKYFIFKNFSLENFFNFKLDLDLGIFLFQI